jgi:hypothetical protein
VLILWSVFNVSRAAVLPWQGAVARSVQSMATTQTYVLIYAYDASTDAGPSLFVRRVATERQILIRSDSFSDQRATASDALGYVPCIVAALKREAP